MSVAEYVSLSLDAALFPLVIILTVMIYAFFFIMAAALAVFAVGVPVCLVLWGIAELRFNPRWPKPKTVLQIIFWVTAIGAMFAAPYFITPKSWEAVACLAALIALFAYFQCVVRDR